MWWLLGIGYLVIGALFAGGIGLSVIFAGFDRLSYGGAEPMGTQYKAPNMWREDFARATTIMFFWGIMLLLLFAISLGGGVRRIIWRFTAPPKR